MRPQPCGGDALPINRGLARRALVDSMATCWVVGGALDLLWCVDTPTTDQAVDLAFDPVAFKKTKHILRAAEFLRDLVSREVVTLKHVAGATMIADVLTKACARAIFVVLVQLVVDYARARRVSPE